MAVHGTRRTESVSWDYEGLLQLLSRLARERSGLPVLRCYWYEATMDGRRTAEQDALADVPGIKLRVAKIRPGRREGVETEIHRDLTTLARNNAVSDALVVSAEEDLAQVIADVQDLGMRVTLVHIAVDGNWTISRALRQESDDIIEISGDHLRPYVELVAGAEPAHPDDDGDLAAVRPLANGHSIAPAASYQQAPAAGNHAPPAIYTAPVVAEYQRPALQLPRSTSRDDRARDDGARDDGARDDGARDDGARDDGARDDRARDDRARDDRAREERTTPTVNGDAPAAARQDIPSRQDMPARDIPSRQDLTSRPDIYTTPATGPRSRPEPVSPAPQSPAARARVAEEPVGYAPPAGPVAPAPQVQVPQGTPEPASGADATQPPAGQVRRLPSARTAVSQGQHGVQSQPGQGQHAQGQPGQGQHAQGQHAQGQHAQGQHAQGQHAQGQHGPGPAQEQARARARPAAPPTAARSR